MAYCVSITKAGSPSVLKIQEIEMPTPKEGEVCVKVHYAGINFADTLMRLGLYQPRPPFPFTPGYEVSGVIHSIGPGVTEFEVGQRVVAAMPTGGQCSHVAVEESRIIPIPNEMGLEDEELIKAASKYWFERFFTDAYQAHDIPMVGAPKFVNELYSEGATVVYLSGRDSPGMLVGCAASLREHGFPVGLTNTAIVLKPDFETPDPVFKEEACRFMAEMGEVVATIDNEPGNVNLFQRQFG